MKLSDVYANVETLDGNVHVIPMSVFQRIVDGETDIEGLEDWRIILRSIISDWMTWQVPEEFRLKVFPGGKS